MAKKNIVSKKPKTTSVMVEIQQLHASMAKDQNALSKLYKKAMTEVNKKHAGVTKLLAKAMKSVAQAKKGKKKSPQNYEAMVSLFQSLKKESVLIKAEQTALNTANKKFAALQKALMPFAKVSTKTTPKAASKVAPKTASKAAPKTVKPAVKKSKKQNKVKNTAVNNTVTSSSSVE